MLLLTRQRQREEEFVRSVCKLLLKIRNSRPEKVKIKAWKDSHRVEFIK